MISVLAAVVLTLTGLGPIRVGMTVEQARRAAGAPLHQAESPNEDCYYLLVEGDSSVAFMILDGRVARVDVSDPRHATLSGLHVGDSEERAKQVYAGRYEIEPHAYVDGHYLIVRSRDKRYALVIETDGRVVTSLRAGSMPAAEFVEGCS